LNNGTQNLKGFLDNSRERFFARVRSTGKHRNGKKLFGGTRQTLAEMKAEEEEVWVEGDETPTSGCKNVQTLFYQVFGSWMRRQKAQPKVGRDGKKPRTAHSLSTENLVQGLGKGLGHGKRRAKTTKERKRKD